MINHDIAARLDELSRILDEQGANPYRVKAYHQAAETLRGLDESVLAIYTDDGLAGLERLPGIGVSIARAIQDVLLHGRLPMLDRLRGEHDPKNPLRSIPGIGRVLARKFHEDLGIETLEGLEAAARDGRLDRFPGLGGKRLEAIRNSVAHRLGRVREASPGKGSEPAVEEILDIDADYRRQSARGALQRIAPRQFNPKGEAWLPVLHTLRGDRHYTALFSNTSHAHHMGMTRDWVIVHCDDLGREDQWTVITSTFGPLKGRRIVRGREAECERYYRDC